MSTDQLTQDVTDTFSQMFPGLSSLTLYNLLYAAVILVVCAVIIRVLMGVLKRATERLKMERSLQYFLRSAVHVFLWFLTILIVAGSLGISTTSLIAVLSVAGLAVSLAVQGTLSNLAGGIMLLVSKPFKAGDYIEAGGVGGLVADVGLVYTKMTTYDNKVVFVPNSEISGSKITNYTTEGKRRVDLTFSTSYDAKPEQVKKAIQDVIGAHPLALFTPEPFVRVNDYKESSVEYVVRVWCTTVDYWTLYYDLLEQVKTAFDKNGIEMTYNHLNVHMIQK